MAEILTTRCKTLSNQLTLFKTLNDMILLVYKNRYKMAKCYTSLTFLQWIFDIDHAKLDILSVVPNIYQ